MVVGMSPPDAEFAQAQSRYIPTFAVLFTQGINEMQTFANRLGQAGLQDSINQESLQRLFRFCERYRRADSKSKSKEQIAAGTLGGGTENTAEGRFQNVQSASLCCPDGGLQINANG